MYSTLPTPTPAPVVPVKPNVSMLNEAWVSNTSTTRVHVFDRRHAGGRPRVDAEGGALVVDEIEAEDHARLGDVVFGPIPPRQLVAGPRGQLDAALRVLDRVLLQGVVHDLEAVAVRVRLLVRDGDGHVGGRADRELRAEDVGGHVARLEARIGHERGRGGRRGGRVARERGGADDGVGESRVRGRRVEGRRVLVREAGRGLGHDGGDLHKAVLAVAGVLRAVGRLEAEPQVNASSRKADETPLGMEGRSRGAIGG